MQPSSYSESTRFDNLLAMLRSLPASPGVLPLFGEIAGHPAFFPGGHGYVGPDFPQSPVMFVGHNFDTDEGFHRSVVRGCEDDRTMKTWINLRGSFLPAAGLDERDCFFTNFYLGAKVHPPPKPGEKKETTNVGKFDCTREYHDACVAGLRAQVRIVKPRVIALLGGNVPKPFGKAFPVYGPYARGTLADVQLAQPRSGHKLRLPPDGSTIQVVALVHPANPRSFESHRAQGLFLRAALAEASRSL